jgi:arsenical-resistance protein 2
MIIPGAINLPAQTFHQTLPILLPILSRSVVRHIGPHKLLIPQYLSPSILSFRRIPQVIFHCSSSNGRGPRCAGWYQDALDNNEKILTEMAIGTNSKAYVLTGGIKAWVGAYPEEVRAL